MPYFSIRRRLDVQVLCCRPSSREALGLIALTPAHCPRMSPDLGSKPPNSSAWKGKAKATEADFNDLNPTITYRHLHSHNLGVKDPLRVVALCDSDAFYAACEQIRLGLDPSLPLVVQQWDSLIAVNHPARKFGITRMEKIKEAKRKCPELIVVHVATFKEGEKEPGYWENPDTLTHKVSPETSNSLHSATTHALQSTTNSCAYCALSGLFRSL